MLRVFPVAKMLSRFLGTMKKHLLDSLDMPKVSTENSYPCLELWIGRPIEQIHLLFHHCSFLRRSVFLPFYWHSAWVTQRNISSDLVDCIKLQILISSVCVKHDIYFDQKCCKLLSSFCAWQHWRCGGWIYAMTFILAAPRRWFFTVQHFRRVAVC